MLTIFHLCLSCFVFHLRGPKHNTIWIYTSWSAFRGTHVLLQYIFKNVNIFYHKNNIFLFIFLFNTSPFLSGAHSEGAWWPRGRIEIMFNFKNRVIKMMSQIKLWYNTACNCFYIYVNIITCYVTHSPNINKNVYFLWR
jgi:hypothetical protein